MNRKHRKWCIYCEYSKICNFYNKSGADVCPIGNFDEYDK